MQRVCTLQACGRESTEGIIDRMFGSARMVNIAHSMFCSPHHPGMMPIVTLPTSRF